MVPDWTLEKESALRFVAAILNLRAKSPNFISDSLVSFAAWNDAYVHAQQFIIEIKFSDPNDSSEIEQSLLREMSDLFAGKVSEEELKNAVDFEIMEIRDMQKYLGFQWSRTELIGEGIMLHGDPNLYFLRIKLQQKMDLAQLLYTGKKCLQQKPFSVLYSCQQISH